MKIRDLVIFGVVGFIVCAIGYRAGADTCTSGARPCSFDDGGGSCCFTVSSIPDADGWSGYGRPQWRVTGASCGGMWVMYLGYKCALPTTSECGSAVDQFCN